jgi:hypothetical protein
LQFLLDLKSIFNQFFIENYCIIIFFLFLQKFKKNQIINSNLLFMKKLLFSFVMLVAIFAIHAQTVIYQDNFDSYTAGTKLVLQNNVNWTTWSNAPGGVEDPVVSTEQSQSASNSVKITADNDLLYKFSNQTTGIYKVEFDYYVPSSGLGGYFNNQHYASPGQQWAVEVYFNPGGTGYLLAGSNTQISFTFPSNQWFHIIFDVDLDDDNAKLTINGTVAHTWPYHYQANNQNGICQLGSMNFYAGYPGGQGGGGTYYLDNFKFTEVIAANPGVFVINPEEPIVGIFGLSGGTKTINLSNAGGSALDYEVIPVYDIPNPNSTSTGQQTITHVISPDPNLSGVGFNNSNKYTVATGYTPLMLKDHIGKTVRQYKVTLGNINNIISGKLCIWKMGPMGMPSLEPPIYEQPISSFIDGYNTITLTQPYLVDGSYIYIGLDLTVVPGGADTFVFIGTDLTPDAQCNKLGRLYRSTVAWTAISGVNGYWDMSIVVDGTPIKTWMALDHTSATLQPNANKDLVITFGAPDIITDCEKNGKIYFHATDFEKEETILDVTAKFFTNTPLPIINVTPISIDTLISVGATETVTVPITVTNTGVADGEYTATEDVTWLSLTGDIQGVVAANGTKTFNIVIDGSTLEIGIYEGTILVTTNDTEHPSFTISCKLTVDEDGIEIFDIIQTIYPNPASTIVNIESNKVINSIEIFNYMGQVVYSATVNETGASADISRLSSGTYIIRINSEGHIQSSKLIIK